MKRRDFVKLAGMSGASLALTSLGKRFWVGNIFAEQAIRINPVPKFELSPWLYMQFMEPLGVTDSSVEAVWNHETEQLEERPCRRHSGDSEMGRFTKCLL